LRSYLCVGLTGLVAAACSFADVTYDQTVKFTGGSMVDMVHRMANNPILGARGGGLGAAFADQTYTVYIKGSKMARVGQTTTTIFDLDAGTMTIVNNERRTYRTETFDEMRQRMEEAQRRMSHGAGGDLQFDVKTESTGQTRTIDGKNASETVLTMTAKSSGANGQMVVKVDSWLIAPDPAMHEAMDFYKRLSQKFAYAFAGGPGMGSAGAGINAAYREMANLDGYPLLSDIAVSGASAAMPGMGGDPNAPIIKTQMQSTNFVVGPVDDSRFSIPADYKQEQGRMGGRPQ